MSGLSDALVAANRAGLSARALARRAQELGYSLNHDTAARYLRGDHGVPDEVTLQAFSEVLGVSLRKLRTAAELPAEDTSPYVPPAEASRLTRRQRRAVDEIIRAMLEPTRAAADDPKPATKPTTRPARLGAKVTALPDAGRRAARRGSPERGNRE